MDLKRVYSSCESNEEFEIIKELDLLVSSDIKLVKDGKNNSLLFGNEDFLQSENDGIAIYLHKNIGREAQEALKDFSGVCSFLKKNGFQYKNIDYKKFTVDFVIYKKKDGKLRKIYIEYNGTYYHSKGNAALRDALKKYIFKKNGEIFFQLNENYHIDTFLKNKVIPLL